MTRPQWHRSAWSWLRNSAAALAIITSLIGCGVELGRAGAAFSQLAVKVSAMGKELRAVRATLNSLAAQTCSKCTLPADPPKKDRGL